MNTVEHSASPAMIPKIRVRSSMKMAARAHTTRYEKHTVRYTGYESTSSGLTSPLIDWLIKLVLNATSLLPPLMKD